MYQKQIYGEESVRTVVTVSLDEATVKLLDQLMKQYKSNRSQIIRVALWNMIQNPNNQNIGEIFNNFIEYMEKLTRKVENIVNELKSQQTPQEEIMKKEEEIQRLRKENEELKKRIEQLEEQLKNTSKPEYDSFAIEMIKDLRMQIGRKTLRDQRQDYIILAKILMTLEDSIKKLKIPSIDDVIRKIYGQTNT